MLYITANKLPLQQELMQVFISREVPMHCSFLEHRPEACQLHLRARVMLTTVLQGASTQELHCSHSTQNPRAESG